MLRRGLGVFLAFRTWRGRVTRENLRADAIAGLIGAIVVLPQGVAFATLAGLPPEYGLYTAMVPAIIAALFGSSWHLVSGPTNAISLVVLATLAPLAEPGSAKYVSLAITLSFVVGAMQLAMGLARLGQLVNFISHTVVIGFTAGAATLIIASQIRNFFGVPLQRGTAFFETLRQFGLHLDAINPWVTGVALFTLAVAIVARKKWPKVPYMVVAMLAGSVLAAALNWGFGEAYTGIRTIGALPSAIPALSMPRFDPDTIRNLLGIALAVTALGLTEAVSIARSVATKSGQRIDGNQEFVGQGLANIVGSFFSAYPSSGSFNRTGVNYEAGARTPLAAVFAAIALLLILLAISPLLAHLPLAVMAALLFLVAWGLFDFHHIETILRTSKSETAVLLVTYLSTLVLHLEMAIVAGVLLSTLVFLGRTSRPTIRSLIPDPEDGNRKFVQRKSGQAECPQLKILRVEGPVYFGAANHVATFLHFLEEHHPEQKHLLLMSRSMNFVDVAGAELLAAEARRRKACGGALHLHGLREGASRLLLRDPFHQEFPDEVLHASKRDALESIFARLDHERCRTCSARIFKECAQVPPDRRGQ